MVFPHSTRKPQALFPVTCVPVPMFFISHIQLPCILYVLCPCVHTSHFLWLCGPIPYDLCPMSPCTLVVCVPFSCAPQVLRSPQSSVLCSRVLNSLCSKVHILCFHHLCAILCVPYSNSSCALTSPFPRVLQISCFVFCVLHDQCPMSQIPGAYVRCLPMSMYS